jgi:SAM-dependent methyltransferase
MDEEDEALRASYDRVAAQYAEAFYGELDRKPFDRELLDAFAERVRGAAQAPGEVWDVGCGPGHVGRYLAERGVAVRGLDLSERMVEQARRLNPGMPFVRGTMLALPVADGTLAGIVSFYAIIHLARTDAHRALGEFHRALRAGGALLLAFHGGEGELFTDEWFGEPVAVHARLFGGDEMADYARQAGFVDIDVREREPYPFEHQTRRVYLSLRKPPAAAR